MDKVPLLMHCFPTFRRRGGGAGGAFQHMPGTFTIVVGSHKQTLYIWVWSSPIGGWGFCRSFSSQNAALRPLRYKWSSSVLSLAQISHLSDGWRAGRATTAAHWWAYRLHNPVRLSFTHILGFLGLQPTLSSASLPIGEASSEIAWFVRAS